VVNGPHAGTTFNQTITIRKLKVKTSDPNAALTDAMGLVNPVKVGDVLKSSAADKGAQAGPSSTQDRTS
jgi:hypothetical protein